ncbi:MAG: rhamnosidase [Planctomycetaceae bacterium]|nr:rhamnosidase [Planctomycetaceae bacterium]
MNRSPRLLLTFLLLAPLAASPRAFAADADGVLRAQRLRCEYRVEPLGVDNPSPELSWIVASAERNQWQTAYRVIVASTPEKLAAGTGDLWDSGRVDGNKTFGVRYEGNPLPSHQRCYWKVMTWDRQQRAGTWSESAMWSVGPLEPADWPGDWIGYDADPQQRTQAPPAPLEGAQWISDRDRPNENSRNGRRVFATVWELPADGRFVLGTLTLSADDVADVYVNGKQIAWTRHYEHARTEDILAHLRAGRNELRIAVWNRSRGYTGLCVKAIARTSSGAESVLVTDDNWKTIALNDDGDAWKTSEIESAPSAFAVAEYGSEPWRKPGMRRDATRRPVYLRDEFTISKPVAQATVYLAALGWADLSINGEPVNTDYFSSGWTDYARRVYYRAYDVGGLLKPGPNAWGAVLADGWYSGHIGWGADRALYGEKPRVRAMLHVQYEDGSSDTFATDDSWQAMRGPTTTADILLGEEYDATAKVAGWDQASATVDGQPVDTGAEVSPVVQWHPGQPVVAVGEFPARSVNEPAPGVYVFDIGQNIAGVARLQVQGRRGQRIQLRFAERLNDDGTLYTANLRLARATDAYICSGDGVEIWQPRQTFHGFQYVEVTGLDEPPALDMITGVALSSDTPLASRFHCSDEQINRLYKNVLWTQRANYIDVPTDCPQRDERMGWTGDAQVYVHTACLTTDAQAFFRKWLVDLTDAQREDGQFPRVAPVVLNEHDGGPAWSDAGVICPWEVYQAYGDIVLLEQQYPSMVEFVEFCRQRSRDEVLPPKQFHCFGDWLSVNADTPREVIYTAYYARSVDLLRRSAEVLGRDEDARKYGELFERIKAAFQQEFVRPDGEIHGNTQCCYVLAIGYGLVDGEVRAAAARRLVADIESRGWKLSTGFIGTKDLMMVLAEIGRNDVALRLLHQREYPGWLFSIAHGATSIWERWDGWTPQDGFQHPDMNSFAHYSFGAVYGWMAENLGGIRATQPAYGQIVIQPAFDPQLDFCEVEYDSIRGPIVSHWRRTDAGRELTVAVPANVTATVRLKNASVDHLLLDGEPIQSSTLADVRVEKHDDDAMAEVNVPSGMYHFVAPAAE